jgi:carbon-monoxide dehydrogenase large subunit
MSLVNRYIGAPIERVEDLRFLRGRGEYVADLARAEMLHAAILQWEEGFSAYEAH